MYLGLNKWRHFLGICLLVLILVACGEMSQLPLLPGVSPEGFPQAKSCKDVAVLLPSTDEAIRWEQNDRPNLEREIIKVLPGTTIRYFNANGDADLQQEQADIALEKGSCILVLAPSDSEKAATIVKKAKAKGVPTIAYARLIQSDDLAFYVTFDSLTVGELQGQYIVDEFEKGAEGDYDLRSGDQLVMINGAKNDNNAVEVRKGAISKLQPLIDDGKLNLIHDKFTPGWNNNEAAQRVQELIQNHDNIKVIYAANDGMAKAIINILGERKGKILVTGQDAEPGNIKNIVRGYQGMTVYKPSLDLAIKTAQVIKGLSQGTDIQVFANNTTEIEKDGEIPSFLRRPIFVDKTNIKDTVVKDRLVSIEDICNEPNAKNFEEVCN